MGLNKLDKENKYNNDHCSCEQEHHHNHCSCEQEHHHEDNCGCGCGHNHGSIEKSDIKKGIIKYCISAVLLILAIILPVTDGIKFIFFLCSYVLSGYNVIITAVKNILKGKVFDENFLMLIATIGAFAIQKYSEAVFVMVFYNVGEMLSDIAVGKSRNSISALMNIKPDFANVLTANGEEKVDPANVSISDVIIVRPGERIPLDGEVIEGEGFIDNSALTGEAVPVEVSCGSKILSGGISQSGLLKVKVSSLYANSTVNRILKMTQEASDKKSKSEKFITKFAAKYTPVVVFLAIGIAIFPPLFGFGTFQSWLYRALTFLVVSCPCALVISVPLSFFASIGKASKEGILIKGGNYIDMLSKASSIVLDKTGTLTKGRLKVEKINAVEGVSEQELLKIAAVAVKYSNHPVSKAVIEYIDFEPEVAQNVEEISGKGVKCEFLGKTVICGNKKLMQMFGIENIVDSYGTSIYVAYDNRFLGSFSLFDEMREETVETINSLKKAGISKTVMLTGDDTTEALRIAKESGVDEFYAELLPGDKVEKIEKIKMDSEGATLFVGDGINDAPVLKCADVGIAMGGIGSDAAIEAADIIIMNDNLKNLSKAIQIARKTIKIVKQNITFSMSIKIAVMILTFLGVSNMWEAVFADVGVTVLAALNSTRVLK